MPATPVRLNAPPETLDEEARLAELMTRRLLGVTPDTTLAVAARLLAGAGVRHLPVLAGERCVGVLTEATVVRALTAPAPPLGPPPLVAQLYLVAAVLRPIDRRDEAAAAMHRTGVDAVLIVEHGRLVGIVTATDLVRSLVPSTTEDGTSDPRPDQEEPGMVGR